MKYILCALMLIILLSGPAGAAKDKKTEETKADDTLHHLREVAVIGTDARFKSLLDSLGISSDIEAPQKMRACLATLPIARMGLGVGYIYAIRRATLLWSTGECILAGRREQALGRILETMKNLGFTESPGGNGTPGLLYTLEEAGAIYTATLTRPEDTVVNGQGFSITKILWKTEDSNVSTMSTLKSLLVVFPFLKDRRIEEAVYNDLGPLNVEMLTLGDASRQSRDWEVILVPPEKAKKGSLYQQIETMLAKLGYIPESSNASSGTFARKSTGSYAYLDRIAGSEKIHIRFRLEK
jgi:hypothetical protein